MNDRFALSAPCPLFLCEFNRSLQHDQRHGNGKTPRSGLSVVRLFVSSCGRGCGGFPLCGPADQTHRFQSGGEEWEGCWERSGGLDEGLEHQVTSIIATISCGSTNNASLGEIIRAARRCGRNQKHINISSREIDAQVAKVVLQADIQMSRRIF
jgi:hypothetical protein